MSFVSYLYRMSIEAIYEIYLKYPFVQTDSRKLTIGEIFFALKGENFNGHEFVEKAFQAGASYCIVDEKEAVINNHCILVDNVLNSLQQLASYHRKQFKIPFIAITGSNGKTTTKELIFAVLSKKYHTFATRGNLNNHIGIPLTILSIPPHAEIAIIEMGANHLNEIASYCQYTLPTHGLITNCGKAHLEGFGGLEGVRKGKGELYDFLRDRNGQIFRNSDLDYLKEMSTGIAKQITYGEYEGDYIGKIVTINSTQQEFLQLAILNQGMETTIQSNLVGNYNFPNIMAAVSIGATFGVSINQIKEAIEDYHPDNSRSQLIKQGSNHIIMDAYNANPTSMKAAIENLYKMPASSKWVILGGMMELGPDSLLEHQHIIEFLEKHGFNNVVLVGGDFAHCRHEFLFIEKSSLAREWIKNNPINNSTILIKGSRSMKMETILE